MYPGATRPNPREMISGWSPGTPRSIASATCREGCPRREVRAALTKSVRQCSRQTVRGIQCGNLSGYGTKGLARVVCLGTGMAISSNPRRTACQSSGACLTQDAPCVASLCRAVGFTLGAFRFVSRPLYLSLSLSLSLSAKFTRDVCSLPGSGCVTSRLGSLQVGSSFHTTPRPTSRTHEHTRKV